MQPANPAVQRKQRAHIRPKAHHQPIRPRRGPGFEDAHLFDSAALCGFKVIRARAKRRRDPIFRGNRLHHFLPIVGFLQHEFHQLGAAAKQGQPKAAIARRRKPTGIAGQPVQRMPPRDLGHTVRPAFGNQRAIFPVIIGPKRIGQPRGQYPAHTRICIQPDQAAAAVFGHQIPGPVITAKLVRGITYQNAPIWLRIKRGHGDHRLSIGLVDGFFGLCPDADDDFVTQAHNNAVVSQHTQCGDGLIKCGQFGSVASIV